MYKHKMQASIPAAQFIAMEGLYAASVIAGNGVVVMQHELPKHAMASEGNSVAASGSIRPTVSALAGTAMLPSGQ